uniref:Apple domain-containing protein n=1 Tax=Timema shepardi TaxID=629360 RepID=A0A7R9B1A7_TIMSH|nr:unnamed protein product [Timema shepardi]
MAVNGLCEVMQWFMEQPVLGGVDDPCDPRRIAHTHTHRGLKEVQVGEGVDTYPSQVLGIQFQFETEVKEDCYDRVAIGQRISSSEVTRTVANQNEKGCEKECEKDLDNCEAFSYRLDVKGNGTCYLTRKLPSRGSLIEDPDSDVFVKKEECRYSVVPPPSYQPRPSSQPNYESKSILFVRLFGRGQTLI